MTSQQYARKLQKISVMAGKIAAEIRDAELPASLYDCIKALEKELSEHSAEAASFAYICGGE